MKILMLSPVLSLFTMCRIFRRYWTAISEKLKPNGTLVFSQEHPITTCHKVGERWEKDGNKRQVAYRLNHYRDEGRAREKLV